MSELPASTESQPQPELLPRLLGMWDGVAVVVGSIIGSGIFLKVGNVDKALLDFGFAPILGVWALVGLVTMCGSLALAELAAMYPHAGGPYLYLREAYGRLPAFLWGWTEFWVVRTGSVGALACATVLYMTELQPMSPPFQCLLAVTIVLGLSLINVWSTRWGANVQNLTAVVKVLFLMALIAVPMLMGRFESANVQPIWSGGETSTFLRALGVAMVAVMWPYDGWINLAPVAEEIHQPQQNVPRAMIVGIGIVILVYLGANLSYHLVLPMSHLATTERAAADVFSTLFGPWGGQLAALGVMCSTFGATNSNMLTGPRIYLAIARDGLVHHTIFKVHGTYKTPANAILLQALWTTILIVGFFLAYDNPKKAFDGLTDSVIAAGLVFYSLTVAAVYVLRWKRPDAQRPYRTWGYPLTPALMLSVYGLTLYSLVVDQVDAYRQTGALKEVTVVGGLILCGVIYYAFARRSARARASA